MVRQFGIIQSLPNPIYARENYFLYYNADYSEEAATKKIGRYVGRTVLTLFDFKPNFLCSIFCEGWWRKYYDEEFFDAKDFSNHLQDAFLLVSDKIKKNTLSSQSKCLILF